MNDDQKIVVMYSGAFICVPLEFGGGKLSGSKQMRLIVALAAQELAFWDLVGLQGRLHAQEVERGRAPIAVEQVAAFFAVRAKILVYEAFRLAESTSYEL